MFSQQIIMNSGRIISHLTLSLFRWRVYTMLHKTEDRECDLFGIAILLFLFQFCSIFHVAISTRRERTFNCSHVGLTNAKTRSKTQLNLRKNALYQHTSNWTDPLVIENHLSKLIIMPKILISSTISNRIRRIKSQITAERVNAPSLL